tara:strand:- start:2549 stop:2950 length:402 start_codon:yes stop_codon:yes gene_type:complete
MADSKLNIQIIITEDGVTPDPTHITEHMSITVQAPAVSKGCKYINAGSDARIVKQGYSGANDAIVVIKNKGTTGFNLHEAANGGSKGNVFGALKSGESMVYRLKKGYDLWAANLSSSSKGSIEFSHWECKENV